MTTIRLRNMNVNETGTIVKVRGTGEITRRLRDMGLVPGTEVLVQGRAPLFDPVNLRVRGNNLTLRNNEADFIEVHVERVTE
jgi:ferrous iron transport protein A